MTIPVDERMTDAEPAEVPLTPTGRVILGMIAFGKRTGYEIKRLVDKSTRNFWAASYGQIYPELRRLEEQGLVRGQPEPTGGRARTVYDLTDRGSAALSAWLQSGDELLYELRDEGMLKLFFSDFEPGGSVAQLDAIRARQEAKLAQLRAVEETAREAPPGARLTLALGIGVTEWIINWCAETQRRLSREEKA